MKSSLLFSLALLCLLLAAGLPGCKKERPDGSPTDWLEDARGLEADGFYFQENRENAPRGALEFYQLALDEGDLDEKTQKDVRHKIDWLSALKLMLAEGYLGEPDYRDAVLALTRFRDTWPDSPHRGQALFFRALAQEYDIDYQDAPRAIADYRLFITENPAADLVPEAMVRIGHCHEFNLDHPDYPKALAAYDAVIAQFGPANDVVRAAGALQRMAVERALYYKARILEDRLALDPDPEKSRRCYADAAECYRRLTDDVFFGKTRFRQAQFVNFRLGCLLAEKLGRPADGLLVLERMAARWSESPWYGKVLAKMDRIKKSAPAAQER